MTSLKFARYHAPSVRSFAMRDFNLRETEINQHYWSFIASSEYSAYRARRFKKVDPSTPATRLFKASGSNAPRIPDTVSNWLLANDKLKNWLRLSVLVSAASSFEMYLGHVARTALASDPLAQYGNPRALDGVCLIKGGVELPYEDVVQGLTKGDWNSREAKFCTVFGVGLLEVRDKKSELEAIRKTRNEFAHGFGRNLAIPEPGDLTRSSSSKLTEENLKKYLGIISSAAKSIDRYLMDNHIGFFEVIKVYHSNANMLRADADQTNRPIEESLKRHIYEKFGITASPKFCRQLILHYDNCAPAVSVSI